MTQILETSSIQELHALFIQHGTVQPGADTLETRARALFYALSYELGCKSVSDVAKISRNELMRANIDSKTCNQLGMLLEDNDISHNLGEAIHPMHSSRPTQSGPPLFSTPKHPASADTGHVEDTEFQRVSTARTRGIHTTREASKKATALFQPDTQIEQVIRQITAPLSIREQGLVEPLIAALKTRGIDNYGQLQDLNLLMAADIPEMSISIYMALFKTIRANTITSQMEH